MTTAESFAAWLLVPVLLACLRRARLLALAILPPLALSAAQWLELIDTSSAHHPIRWLVPITGLSAAMFAAWRYSRTWLDVRGSLRPLEDILESRGSPSLVTLRQMRTDAIAYYLRALVASILVFASGCADIPALLAWSLPGEWVLVPLQIAVCLVVIGALLAPERWFHGR
jgi:hypothetical protein